MTTIHTIIFRGSNEELEMVCKYFSDNNIQYRNIKNNKYKYLTDKEKLEGKRNKAKDASIKYYYDHHEEILEKKSEKTTKIKGRPRKIVPPEKPIKNPIGRPKKMVLPETLIQKPKGRPRTVQLKTE